MSSTNLNTNMNMKYITLFCILLQVLHAEEIWTPRTNSATEGQQPAYNSTTYALADLLFTVPKTSNGWIPRDGFVVSANCKKIGIYNERSIIEANLSLSGCGSSELLLILCSDGDGFKVVLASFQDRGSQYYEILSVKNIDNVFTIETRYSIPGTDPYSTTGNIRIEEKEGKLFMR